MDGIFIDGIFGKNKKAYPAWRYHAEKEPVIVQNTEEDLRLRQDGYEPVSAPMSANTGLVNWYWDMEDFSPKQLCVYAQEEYGVELPIDAPQDKLFKTVLELMRCAPQNENRLVLMAHTIKMNHDETICAIRRQMEGGVKETQTYTVEL